MRMWPSAPVAGRVYDLANVVLVISLVLGAASTVLVVWMGNVKEAYLRRDLAATGKAVAEADARAAAANLELARIKTPRQLTRISHDRY